MDSLKHRSIALGRVIGASREPGRWPEAELGKILRHQLAAPLEADLGSAAIDAAANVPAGTAWCVTFRDLFEHSAPPLELLEIVKAFAKDCRAKPHGPLPPEVALVLYYGCIAAALLRHGRNITQLDAASLLDGIRWALSCPWLDNSTRKLFEASAGRLGQG